MTDHDDNGGMYGTTETNNFNTEIDEVISNVIQKTPTGNNISTFYMATEGDEVLNNHGGSTNGFITPTTCSGNTNNSVSREEYDQLYSMYQQLVAAKSQGIPSNVPMAQYYPRNDHEEKEIIRCVKTQIFKKIKFISSQNQLDDLSNVNTIGRKIIARFNIPPDTHYAFWSTYKNVVRHALNSKRNEVQTAVQKVIRSMMEMTKKMKIYETSITTTYDAAGDNEPPPKENYSQVYGK